MTENIPISPLKQTVIASPFRGEAIQFSFFSSGLLRRLKSLLAMTLLIVISLSTTAPLAATPDDLAKIQQDLNNKKQQDGELKKQLDKTESELSDLRSKLVKAARDQGDSEDTLIDLEDTLQKLQKDEAEQRAALGEQQTNMQDVLIALLRMARTPAELMLIRPEKPVDNIRSAILLRHALPHYAEKAQALSAQLDKLQQTRADILDKQNAVKEAQKNFSTTQEQLNALLTERQYWLKATESQRGELQKQISSLSKEAQNVQELLQKVAISGLALPDKLKKNGRISFTAPAKGRILYGFGDADDVGSPSRGLTMRVRGGEMIVAPADGQVVFAGPFKGYGNILIIRHGDDYHSFLAGFGQLDSTVGQVVNAGEPLGRTSMEQGTNAQLYYELRFKGAPVNPSLYIHSANLAKNDKNSPTP